MAHRLLIRKAGGSLVVTLPAGYLRDLQWQEGDRLRVEREGECLIVSREDMPASGEVGGQ